MAKLIGILNITPDSFSDGGKNLHVGDALLAFNQMVEEGADIIDIGAESTRPNAVLLSPEEEWERLNPFFTKVKNSPFLQNISALSIDSRHAETFQNVLKIGFDVPIIINDVSSNWGKKMIEIAKRAISYNQKSKIVVMHNLGIPADKSITLPIQLTEDELVDEVKNFALNKIEALTKQGIERENIIFDIGIGFGKTAKQSLDLLRNLKQFKALKTEILVGHSRKSFLSLFTNKQAEERDFETAIISSLIAGNAYYIRVHNVPLNKQALEIVQSFSRI